VKVNEKPTNAVILQCIDTRHSPTCFGNIKCHNQGGNHDPADVGAQCYRNLKDRLNALLGTIICLCMVQRGHWWKLFIDYSQF
jgi:hypothetical protein